MRTIKTKVYLFNELSKDAQQKAIENFRNSNSDNYDFVWDNTKGDAKEIGLKIISLDDHRPNEGEFMLAACEVAQNIFNEHGEVCDTYKTAEAFMKEWQPVFDNYMVTEEGEGELMEIEDEFLKSLLEDYRILYNRDIDYQYTDEAIQETIEINQYEFTKEGNRF